MKSRIKVSVIIPVRIITNYVRETVNKLRHQSTKKFEIIIVSDEKEKLPGTKVISSGKPTPSFKRNLGLKAARGEILAFLDDDSYPDKDWLKNSLKIFNETNKNIVAVCGPTLTPPADNIYQKASGWVWSSWFGSGGAGVFRNRVMSRREVDDFPSVNLLVRKDFFTKVGGFDVKHWPGEDTKLCLDLIKNGGRIIYDPSILVYHHRRSVIIPHLKQISRYAERRGFFARHFPETSFRLGYFFPSLFTYGVVGGLILSFFFPLIFKIFIFCFISYLILLLLAGIEVFLKEKNVMLVFLVMISILLTHLTYGAIFLIGYLKKEIKTVPHKLDERKKAYSGG